MSPVAGDIDVRETILTLPAYEHEGEWKQPEPVWRIELQLTGYATHLDLIINGPTPTKSERLQAVEFMAHQLRAVIPEGER